MGMSPMIAGAVKINIKVLGPLLDCPLEVFEPSLSTVHPTPY
jgi:hypothetical protein